MRSVNHRWGEKTQRRKLKNILQKWKHMVRFDRRWNLIRGLLVQSARSHQFWASIWIRSGMYSAKLWILWLFKDWDVELDDWEWSKIRFCGPWEHNLLSKQFTVESDHKPFQRPNRSGSRSIDTGRIRRNWSDCKKKNLTNSNDWEPSVPKEWF